MAWFTKYINFLLNYNSSNTNPQKSRSQTKKENFETKSAVAFVIDTFPRPCHRPLITSCNGASCVPQEFESASWSQGAIIDGDTAGDFEWEGHLQLGGELADLGFEG